MFAEARTDCFFSVVRICCASLLRLQGISNGILSTLASRWDSPMCGGVSLYKKISLIIIKITFPIVTGRKALVRHCRMYHMQVICNGCMVGLIVRGQIVITPLHPPPPHIKSHYGAAPRDKVLHVKIQVFLV